MALQIIGRDLKTYGPGDPGYDNARIENLESQVGELMTAVIDLQNRMSRQDGEPLRWPADSYGPAKAKPPADV